MQAARLRVPQLGDLRWRRIDLRLRPLRRAAQAERQEPVVARDAPGARRHRRAGLGDHPAPAGLGGQRPPGRLHRPARRLPGMQAPLPRGPSRRQPVPAQAVDASGRVREVRPDDAARVQPDVQDDDRAGRGGGLGRLPAARDGAGDLHQLQERPAVRPQEAAVRDRPDRQVVSQRDHARQLHLPHARVRADGDGVLRPARRGRSSGSSTGSRSASTGTSSWGYGPTTCSCAPTTPTSSATTHRARATSSTSSRSAGRSSRGSPTAATSTSRPTPSTRARSSSTSTRRPRSATSRT